MTGKPECKLIGTERKAKLNYQADEFVRKAMNAESYDQVLILCHDYVEVT